MSGLFGSTLIKGTRITDFSETTVSVGITIPFGYGRFTSGGNVIWAPLPPKERRTVKRQGKGGVKQETYTYTLSYSVAFAKGPIYGYWWIKRNGKVVWTQDPAAPVEDQAYAAKWAQRATFYYGTTTQLPDSTIESYEGTGQVSAFHRIAHVVLEDDDVTENGGAVPTYEACVIASAPDVYVTSKPYPIVVQDNMTATGTRPDFYMLQTPIDNMVAQGYFVSGALPKVVNYWSYTMQPESVTAQGYFVSGNLQNMVTYTKYQNWPPENIMAQGVFVSGSLPVVAGYIKYNTGQPDNITSQGMFISGSLA